MSGWPDSTRPAPGRAPAFPSVVIPVRNGAAHLGEQLDALAAQTHGGRWEVVVVDNGSTDGSAEVARCFAARLPSLRVVDASARRGLNHARNVGARTARGDFLAFCDADDVVTPGWLEALVAAAPGGHVIGGAIENSRLNGGRFEWRQEAPLAELPVKHGFLPAAPGGNCGVWTEAARHLGWDERFRFGSSDIEFAWRAALASYRLAFAPAAVISQRHRHTMPGMARQWFLYGKSGCQLYRAFRDSGMRPDARHAADDWRWIARNAPDAVRSTGARGAWVKRAAFRAGRLAGSAAHRVAFP